MTFKRRRKHALDHIPEPKHYRFVTNSQETIIVAPTLELAKMGFQERFGFYPEKGVNYVVPSPNENNN